MLAVGGWNWMHCWKAKNGTAAKRATQSETDLVTRGLRQSSDGSGLQKRIQDCVERTYDMEHHFDGMG